MDITTQITIEAWVLNGEIADDAQGNPPDFPPEFNSRYCYVGMIAKEALDVHTERGDLDI